MKKFAKIFGIVCAFAFVLTGCATVSNIKNDKNEIIYNGNAAALVGDYLYFGNGFSNDYSSPSNLSDADYKNNAGTAYLARVNLAEVSEMKPDEKYYSPKNVENVAGEVAANAKSFTFVLGDQIYYATPYRNQRKENGSIVNHYDYTTIYRSKLNGDSKKELFSTNGVISNIEVLKYDGKYYIVLLAGSTLTKIDLSSGKAEDIATNVTSVALPKTYEENKKGSTLDWNGKIFFTGTDSDKTGVFEVSISGGEKDLRYSSSGATFVGRERDVVFFTENSKTYKLDTNDNSHSFNSPEFFIRSTSITKISLVVSPENEIEGYAFMSGSSLNYAKNGQSAIEVEMKDLTSYTLLTISGGFAYLSTSSGIYRIDLVGYEAGTAVQTIVSFADSSVYSGGLYAFDGKYIYFYAKLQDLPAPDIEDEETEDAETEETDGNYYLYRAQVGLENEYQLLGRTTISSRHVENKDK